MNPPLQYIYCPVCHEKTRADFSHCGSINCGAPLPTRRRWENGKVKVLQPPTPLPDVLRQASPECGFLSDCDLGDETDAAA